MIRFLLGVATNLVLAAFALLIADWLLADVTLQLGGFLVAVAIFTLAQSILGPFVFNMARKYASALLGGVGLVSTFLALWVATLFSGGIQISGTGWVLAPLIVWIITALGGWIILGIFVERYLKKREKMKLVRQATKHR
ncbi:phage holin family protein [Leucobacter sp. Z1108]|uniref:phage holin family protein n=1 Tax=unclassified Leucobacter TaxID=2621730 RepID=UPI003D97AB75